MAIRGAIAGAPARPEAAPPSPGRRLLRTLGAWNAAVFLAWAVAPFAAASKGYAGYARRVRFRLVPGLW